MKKQSVTIGIPAFNEELNIEIFLRSLFDQKIQHIILQEILVYSDASDDKTDAIVEKLSKKYPKIKLIRGKSRKGKYFRVNELFKRCKSDVLVLLDADIALAHNDFLEKIVKTLMSDKNATMVSADVKLIRAKGFIPELIHTSFVMGDFIRLGVPGYDIAENFHGAATAYKKSFIKQIDIPTNLSDPHLYIYLCARKVKGFRYSRDAVFLQNPPTTFNDLAQILERSIGKEDPQLVKIFGKQMLTDVWTIPVRAKIIGIWKCFLWQPFYTPLALLVNFYIGRFAQPKKIDKSPIWKINKSTKKPIVYEK